MPALNLLTPPNVFSDSAGVLRCPNSRSITASVLNAAVYYQLAIATAGVSSAAGAEVWSSEVFMPPGYWSFSGEDFPPSGICHGIRFRVAVTGLTLPASVNANA